MMYRSFLPWRFVGLGAVLLSLGACASVNEGPALNVPVPAKWSNGTTGSEPYRYA